MTQYTWEDRRASYARRVKHLTDQLNFTWLIGERNELLDRLTYVAGDPVTGPDLRAIVAAYNRELIGRRKGSA